MDVSRRAGRGEIWMLSCLHTPTPAPAPASGGGARVIAEWGEVSPKPDIKTGEMMFFYHQEALIAIKFCIISAYDEKNIIPGWSLTFGV